ncbi:hypothetical protein GCM10012275_48100 [Longimycelium tulufanense]|uniref:Uncharacterized protein n=2 Tax=Longimycelium tulufanense TaxID=907463 RepID=A0A8J3CIE6_9PSEU|nr:hypothetical protein GCM10012275_48100 [Longimycelium tulufanense]
MIITLGIPAVLVILVGAMAMCLAHRYPPITAEPTGAHAAGDDSVTVNEIMGRITNERLRARRTAVRLHSSTRVGAIA